MKNYYDILEVPPTAPPGEIKRAFRHQIARYHPDKVQHLGKEFQEMAATRAAELTEAYRVLSDEGRRAEYDRSLARSPVTPAAPSPAATRPSSTPEPHGAEPPPAEAGAAPSRLFSEERASRDEFVRKAVLGRFFHALQAVLGDSFDQPSARGFDAAIVPKPKLFARTRGPRVLVKFVPKVDASAVSDAWSGALKWAASAPGDVCVLLAGSAIAAERELAGAIGEQRRKPTRGVNVTLVPVDARDWTAHIPKDAPPLVRTLLDRIQKHR